MSIEAVNWECCLLPQFFFTMTDQNNSFITTEESLILQFFSSSILPSVLLTALRHLNSSAWGRNSSLTKPWCKLLSVTAASNWNLTFFPCSTVSNRPQHKPHVEETDCKMFHQKTPTSHLTLLNSNYKLKEMCWLQAHSSLQFLSTLPVLR